MNSFTDHSTMLKIMQQKIGKFLLSFVAFKARVPLPAPSSREQRDWNAVL